MTPPKTVILLHGMGRSRASLLILARHLRKHGYAVHRFGYQTSTTSLDGITRQFLRFLKRKLRTDGSATFHLIGHSLGNIIVRNGFRFGYPEGLGRIVMLAPPNRPAHLARRLADNRLFQLLTGDSGQKLGDAAFYRQLPAPPVEFGVIAGSAGQRLTFNEPNDSIVALEATKLDGMSDQLIVPQIHGLIMNAQATRAACVRFLESGSF